MTAKSPEPRIIDWQGLAILAAAMLWLALLWSFRLERSQAEALMFSDATVYVGGAESFSKGEGYRLGFLEGDPKVALYPPLLSGYLSLWWSRGKTFDSVSGELSGGLFLLTAIGMLLGYRFARQESVPPIIAAMGFAHLAAAPVWFSHTVKFYS